jgi:hypothetical protein
MNFNIKILFILSVFLFVDSALATDLPVLLENCPEDDICLQMDINLGKRDRVEVIEKEVRYGSYSDYILSVRGKLNGGPEKMHRLKYRSWTDGIECNDFGQGRVAVRGFTPKFNPLLLTSSGVIEITNEAFKIGCKDCVKLYEKSNKKIVRMVLAPSWDMTIIGYSDAIVTYSENGEIFLKNQNACISLSNNTLFKVANPENCIQPEMVGHYKKDIFGLEISPGDWVYYIKGSKYFILVRREACS